MTPPPGSPEATKQGCTCPVFDNCKGRGCGLTDKDGEPLYYIHKRCPLHGAVLNSKSTLQEQGAIEANEWPLTAALSALVVVAGFAMFVF